MGTSELSQFEMLRGWIRLARRSTSDESSTSRSACCPLGAFRRSSQARTVLGAAPVALAISRSERWPTEADLHLAQSLATRQYERNDIKYNLACVYAMSGRRAEAMELTRALAGTPWISSISANLHRYFASLEDDPDFLALLDSH
jgi:hypothetical protein